MYSTALAGGGGAKGGNISSELRKLVVKIRPPQGNNYIFRIELQPTPVNLRKPYDFNQNFDHLD